FADEDELQFASGLLRDAAYSLLSDDQKERAHARAAEWLEKLGEVEALPIAMHFALGGEQERARPHYVRAAREALSGNDFEAVRSCVEEGLSGGAQGELAVELHLLSAEAARWQGDNSRALRAAKAALTGSTRGSASWFRAAGEACVLSAKSGRPSQCVALASDLLQAEFGAGGEGTARVIALCRVATQLVHLGELD